MRITELWRHPVKSVGGERLDHAQLGPYGIDGDRAWGIFDPETDTTLTARREPQLLFATASMQADEVVLTLPDGTETNDDADLSSWLGRDVELRRASGSTTTTFENPMDWEREADWIAWESPTGSFHDSGRSMVSLCGVDTAREWDLRRFRQNIWFDIGDEAALEGATLTIADAELDVTKRIDRCVMVTRPQPDMERDLNVLRTIHAELDSKLGVGALVRVAGVVSIGDPIEVSSVPTSPST